MLKTVVSCCPLGQSAVPHTVPRCPNAATVIFVFCTGIVGYIQRELLSNNCAVNLFSMITKYCTIIHYSKINLCYHRLLIVTTA